MNENTTAGESLLYTKVLDYQIQKDGFQYDYDSYCEPLKWYIELYFKYSMNKPDTYGELEKLLNFSQGMLTKRLNLTSKQHSRLRPNEINEICLKLNTPLSVILYLYEHQNIFEENRNIKRNFDAFIFLLTGGLDKIVDYARILQDDQEIEVSKHRRKELFEVNSVLKRWQGKWYFYFPSSDSGIISERKKKIQSNTTYREAVEDDLKELFDIYSEDHIYCGTINIEEGEDAFTANLQYLTNPRRPVIATMEGNVAFSKDKRAIFITPTAQKDNENMYIIVHTTNDDPEADFAIASVLTLSKNRVIKRRRPCCLRMILSRKPILTDSRTYKIICAELMMNDDFIRIDGNGYGELIRFKDDYNSPALNKFLELYPSIETLEADKFIPVSKCAYIRENLIRSISEIEEMGEDEILYLEALLRLHSTAPWYSKVKAEKSEELEIAASHD